MTFMQRIEAAYGEDIVRSDSGGLADGVVMLGGLALAATIVVTFFTKAFVNKAVDGSNCVEGSSSYNSSSDASEKACSGNVAKDQGTSFKEDSAYKSRYKN